MHRDERISRDIRGVAKHSKCVRRDATNDSKETTASLVLVSLHYELHRSRGAQRVRGERISVHLPAAESLVSRRDRRMVRNWMIGDRTKDTTAWSVALVHTGAARRD